MKQIRWGVLGVAKIGTTKVIPAMQQASRGHVMAIASRDLARAQAAAAQLGIARAHASYEALLADPDIDAVYIPLPNHLHVPWSIRAMEAGKNVLCEKPVALTAAEAEALVAAEARTGRRVLEAFMVRHHPQWQQARALVRAGRIGALKLVQATFSYFNPDPANIRNRADIGGGGFYDIGCYEVVTGRYFFGAEPARVVALVERDPTFGTDRLSSALLDFGAGRQLTFSCSTQLMPYQRAHLFGTEGRIEIEIPYNAPPGVACRTTLVTREPAETQDLAAPPCDQYTLQADAAARIFLGESEADFPIADAIRNMRILDALYRSAASGAWETV